MKWKKEWAQAGMAAHRPWGEGLGSLLQSLDAGATQAEVQRESQGRVLLVGLRGVGKSTLYNELHGWEVSPVGAAADEEQPAEEMLGLFTLLDLPRCDAPATQWPRYEMPLGDEWSDGWATSGGWSPGEWSSTGPLATPEADLVVFVVDGQVGMQPDAYRWFCRWQARGQPLVVALNKMDGVDEAEATARARALAQKLAVPVIPLSAQTGWNVRERLLPQIAELCPGLVIPLGRELSCYRREAAQTLIRRSALTCGLLGLEPVPFLDMPFQMMLELRMVMRLAALYGRTPGQSGGSRQREWWLALAAGAMVRYCAQQLAKLVPVFGWAVSGLLSLVGSWLVGWLAMHYFERLQRGERWNGGALERWNGGALERWNGLIGDVGTGRRARPRRVVQQSWETLRPGSVRERWRGWREGGEGVVDD